MYNVCSEQRIFFRNSSVEPQNRSWAVRGRRGLILLSPVVSFQLLSQRIWGSLTLLSLDVVYSCFSRIVDICSILSTTDRNPTDRFSQHATWWSASRPQRMKLACPILCVLIIASLRRSNHLSSVFVDVPMLHLSCSAVSCLCFDSLAHRAKDEFAVCFDSNIVFAL